MKSKLHELLLTEGIGNPPEYKELKHYLGKQVKTKVISKSDLNQTEDQVVASCKKWLKSNGWISKTIYTGGIPLGSRYAENPAKGIPDSIIFNLKTKRVVWIEYKKSKGGLISTEQTDWHNLLRTCGHEVYVINSVKLLEEVLTK